MGNDPIESVSWSSRHHWANGLYLLGLDLYPDRLTLRVFTSRPVSTAELVERLTLNDAANTPFETRAPDGEYLDGRGAIEFKPAPPDGFARLTLRDGRGSSLFSFSSDGTS
jgi:hypothetical protein